MQRTPHGSTLIEMLVCTLIMSFVSLAFLNILLINFHTNAKVSNITDTVDSMRILKERISKDVRMGRSLGDTYGTNVTDANGGNPLTFTTGSDQFPSANDPVWTTGTVPTPSGWPGPPWSLSNQCLIVQVPVNDNHSDSATAHGFNAAAVGWPSQIPADVSNPKRLYPQDNVETHIYRLVADPNNPGDANNPKEYLLQFASFGGWQSGNTVPGYIPATHTYGPQTLMGGIIGPLDTATNSPKIFQFVDRTNISGTAVDSLTNPTYAPNYTGVVINMEIRKHTGISTSRRDFKVAESGFKMEVFLRNNALATSVGQPADANIATTP